MVISMGIEKFAKNCNEAVDFICSCWDENNPKDGKSFDERIKERMDSLGPDVRAIVQGSIDWADNPE